MCSSAGRSSSSDGTTELIGEKGLYYAMWRQQVGEGRIAPTAVPRNMRIVTA